jgi:starch synthase
MNITFAASESAPLAKTGGLADVVGALPRELVRLGHKVTVFLPFYARIKRQIEGEPKVAVRSITIPFRDYNRFVSVVDGGKRDDVQYYFIDCPELFDRKELYGPSGGDYADNAERFGLFCRTIRRYAVQPPCSPFTTPPTRERFWRTPPRNCFFRGSCSPWIKWNSSIASTF